MDIAQLCAPGGDDRIERGFGRRLPLCFGPVLCTSLLSCHCCRRQPCNLINGADKIPFLNAFFPAAAEPIRPAGVTLDNSRAV
jgi:hypothetical protein